MSEIRAWRSGTAATPPRAAEPPDRQSALLKLAGRVAGLSISIRDPSRFAEERSEIVHELRRLARGALKKEKTMPERIQLSRRKGWRKPPHTIKVDRSGKWGNPFEPPRDTARAYPAPA
jgi:hypothetical protein